MLRKSSLKSFSKSPKPGALVKELAISQEVNFDATIKDKDALPNAGIKWLLKLVSCTDCYKSVQQKQGPRPKIVRTFLEAPQTVNHMSRTTALHNQSLASRSQLQNREVMKLVQ